MAGLLGRDVELQAIHDALVPARGALGIVLEGEAGIGKTALWQSRRGGGRVPWDAPARRPAG